ncbi:MAG: glycoside hydrolase family 88 protein [Bacteroidota bacterium]
MKICSAFSVLLYLFFISSTLFAQEKYGIQPTKNPIEGSPIEILQQVADRIIFVTPFEYNLIVPKAKTEFNYVKYIDFGRTFGADREGVAYAISVIESTTDTLTNFDVSHNDGLQIFINGEKVFEQDGDEAMEIAYNERTIDMTHQFLAQLKKGSNTILIKSRNSGKHDKWQVFLQPTGALSWQSPIKHLKLDVTKLPYVDESIGELSNFLVMGLLPLQKAGLEHIYDVEKADFRSATLYQIDGKPYAWSLPKIELHGDVIGNHPVWGTYYNYNYHTAGVAWGFAALAERTGDQKYNEYARRYCDFMLDNYDFMEYIVEDLTGLQSANHQQINKPLLDFTAAPALPFIYRLRKGYEFNQPKAARDFVESVQTYLQDVQVRSDDGTFTRLTPKKYTTWTDDMYMGIPFLLQSALLENDPKKRQAWFDDAAQNVLGFYKRTFDEKAGLFKHGSYSEQPDVPIQHWTRAQGWATFAMAEVLTYLPKSYPLYSEVQTKFEAHLARCIEFQDAETGLFHNIIDNSDTKLETSGTALVMYGLAKGVNEGWLSDAKFETAAKSAWKGLKSQIESDGTVHNIIMGTGLSETVEYYESRPFVDNDSHGLIGLFFGALEMEKLLH